ncbi:Type 4 prepilin-like proteins leader peptide-processing enzyme [Zhongshania aliphaticivorans]|uniref:Prepilin leader peptidase/N-methyltransferase n=1 Tax=Zhongshania aliphaticivorans TaxID=1470434 RepID=A0A5S9N3X7_9GAMM|nr:A24 family peptidase [Zhongshania aliphaticivorans]CAA0083022.1 Type 4 prepilin-like proteins leader peptide-processing enzyme [Zhongshania aliphaticivorans]CAA0083732.1 Type 4 prepilin-like proteins leader peptide-processing enzyme [Zhongshania aliphaticivorans]
MTLFEAFANAPILTISLVGVLGLMMGSFFNVVIYRLPKMMEANWLQECEYLLAEHGSTPSQSDESTSFNLAFPNSHCPACKTPIKIWQNLPVISYLLLRGRCANCQASISIRYPLIEVITALISIIPLFAIGITPHAFAIIIFSWMLLVLTVIDIDHQLLPDQITLPLLWLGLLYNSVFQHIPIADALWGAMAGYLILWSVFWLFKIVTGKEGMGYGDFKLLAALGAWLGWQYLPLIILLSSLVGAVFGGIILVAQRNATSTPMPFGPYLTGAGWIAVFWGDVIIETYLGIAGFK